MGLERTTRTGGNSIRTAGWVKREKKHEEAKWNARTKDGGLHTETTQCPFPLGVYRNPSVFASPERLEELLRSGSEEQHWRDLGRAPFQKYQDVEALVACS